MGWPIPYAEPGVDGRPPRRPTGVQAAVLAARARLRRPGRRRLAVLDTHLPWRISGFRDAEFRELVRRRPDSLAFTLHRTTDPFPTPVHELADFPALAARAGVTDVYLVFLNFACDVLGLADEARAAGVGGLRRDLSLAPELRRYGIRVHATLHPGGGLLPDTPVELLRAVQARTATLFSYDQRVLDLLPGAISCTVPFDVACFGPAPRPHDGVVRLVFAADDRPRKGLRTLLDAYERIGRGPHADRFHLDLAGPAERHVQGLANRRRTLHGWLQPDALAELFRRCDVVVAPATADRPEDGEGDTGMVDGFPSTSVRSAMATGCLLVGSNPAGDARLVTAGRDYLRVPERDPAALEAALLGLLDGDRPWDAIAQRGAERVRAHCDARVVVDHKLRAMGLA